MTTVRDALHQLLRATGVTTIFGNPGSTELTMLRDLPDDLTYVLGLQEAAVVGMADGWAQAHRRPALVNLHTAPGLGNAMGSLVNASWSGAPLVVTAGQQVRAMITEQHWLTDVDAVAMARPAVKWAFEPPRAQDVPLALAKAIHLAQAAPSGPVFVSVPMDDWDAEVDDQLVRDLAERTVTARPVVAPGDVRRLAALLDGARRPALVLGARADLAGGWDAAVRLAEAAGLEVWTAPSSGRGVFPESSPRFRGFLPFGARQLSEHLAPYDLVLVVGAPAFTCYPFQPARLVPAGTRLVLVTEDADALSRAAVGDGLLGDPAALLTDLAALVTPSTRATPEPRPVPDPPSPAGELPSAEQVYAALAPLLGEDVLVCHESPSNLAAYHRQVRNDRSGGYLTTPSGGLGYGLAAGVGAALAEPDRPVLVVVGDGSLHYTAPAIWTAVQHGARLVVLVLANREYAILKAFGALNDLPTGLPGLDLPGLDSVPLATAYGARGVRADGAAAAAEAVGSALAGGGVTLVEVAIDPEVPELL